MPTSNPDLRDKCRRLSPLAYPASTLLALTRRAIVFRRSAAEARQNSAVMVEPALPPLRFPIEAGHLQQLRGCRFSAKGFNIAEQKDSGRNCGADPEAE